MNLSSRCREIFERSVRDFHQHNNVDQLIQNPFEDQSIDHLLYEKNYIDTVQWHLEDIVRDPKIDPVMGLNLKRRIDRSNQERTDLVEKIDDHLLVSFQSVIPLPEVTVNTESPAWAIDRLSILILKIYHMQEEVLRKDVDQAHIHKCQLKLDILLEQQKDLSTSIDELINDIQAGRKRMKVYRQMKMYNDPSLNPVLYNQSK